MAHRRSIVVLGLLGLAGFVILLLPGSTALEVLGGVLLVGVLLVGIGLIVVRLGPQSQPDRAREAAAREQFDQTGEWPTD